jgi:acylglycerol lipase
MPMDHSEGTFQGSGGTQLFEQSWLPYDSPRAVLVLVHGLKDHSSRYGTVARQLTEAAFAVHAFDLRGHGRSEGPRAFVRSFSEYVGDLAIFVARVRGGQGRRPLFLLGHSMGGAIVTLFALLNPNSIQGFALSAPGLKVTDDVTPGRIRAVTLLAKIVPRAHVYRVANSDFSRDPHVVEDMDRDPLIDQRRLPARLAVEFLGAMVQIQRRTRELTLPFLVMHGTGDRLTNPQGSRDLYQNASSSDKTLKLYNGLYHDLLHEPEHARVSADLLDWLSQQSQNRAGGFS